MAGGQDAQHDTVHWTNSHRPRPKGLDRDICVKYRAVADLGAPLPPSQSKFFIFMQFSAKIISNNRLAPPPPLGLTPPPLWGWRPLSGTGTHLMCSSRCQADRNSRSHSGHGNLFVAETKPCFFLQNINKYINKSNARMHSSRMRTVRNSSRLQRGGVPGPGGCTWSRGVYLVPGGVPGPGGVYLVPGGAGGTCPGTPSPCEQNDRQV